MIIKNAKIFDGEKFIEKKYSSFRKNTYKKSIEF